eukprot:TRINITY_DN2564_c0_g1_i1.p1 TRINITY_DN2564_c0_g1~~TRINITY_DN2564_c0_g1_i1.p1  ORF type:complete len:811 (+),score=142.11 TRINITY_DN2564_c0_g1_i1:267-2699(+)
MRVLGGLAHRHRGCCLRLLARLDLLAVRPSVSRRVTREASLRRPLPQRKKRCNKSNQIKCHCVVIFYTTSAVAFGRQSFNTFLPPKKQVAAEMEEPAEEDLFTGDGEGFLGGKEDAEFDVPRSASPQWEDPVVESGDAHASDGAEENASAEEDDDDGRRYEEGQEVEDVDEEETWAEPEEITEEDLDAEEAVLFSKRFNTVELRLARAAPHPHGSHGSATADSRSCASSASASSYCASTQHSTASQFPPPQHSPFFTWPAPQQPQPTPARRSYVQLPNITDAELARMFLTQVVPYLNTAAYTVCETGAAAATSTSTTPSHLSPHGRKLVAAKGPREPVVLHNVLLLEPPGLWPVVWIKREGVYYVGVPALDESAGSLSVLNQPSIAATFAVLLDIAKMVTPYQPFLAPTQLAELQTYFCSGIPFGTPLHTNDEFHMRIAETDFLSLEQPTHRVPVWRPVAPVKAKNHITVVIRDTVRCAQYCRKGIPDACSVSGVVICHVDVPEFPEVALIMRSAMPAAGDASLARDPITQLAVHPCVSSVELLSNATLSPTAPVAVSRKLCFVPPLQQFQLAAFSARQPSPCFPIRGSFQKTFSTGVHGAEVGIVVQLRLEPGVPNAFAFCEAHIPLKVKGRRIASCDAAPSAGNVSITNSRTLVWNIGQKFPGQEVSLHATLLLTPAAAGAATANGVVPRLAYEPPDWGEGDVDPLCSGAIGYVLLNFRLMQWNLSGVSIDHKAVSCAPSPLFSDTVTSTTTSSGHNILAPVLGRPGGGAAAPPKVTVQRECLGQQYYIWDCSGSKETPRWCPTVGAL